MTLSDSRFEHLLGQVLSIGSTASTAVLAVGLALQFLPVNAPRLSRIALHTGLIILMGTPMMRVVVSMAEYMRRRDWVFVGVTLIVLLELAASVIDALTA